MAKRNEIGPAASLHPGVMLKAELKERGIKQREFAEKIGMRPSHLSSLLHGARNITPQLAARIESVLHIPASVWLNLQGNYKLDMLRTSDVVHGYGVPEQNSCVLGEPTRQEDTLWDLAFRSGQKDMARKIKARLEEMGLPAWQIAEALNVTE